MTQTKDFVSNGFITLDDGTRIKDVIDGISCSHNDFKKICLKCMLHFSKDFPLRLAFYKINKEYLERQ